jgi:integrase
MADILTIGHVAALTPGENKAGALTNKFYGYAKWEYRTDRKGNTQRLPTGFGVVVTAAGVRSFVLNYELKGKQRRYTLGRATDANSLTKAITEAKKLRDQIDAKVDPMEAKEAERATRQKAAAIQPTTVRDLFELWLKTPRRRDKDNRPQQGCFKNHILPAIGAVPYESLKRSQVADMYDSIASKSGPVAANRAISYLSSVLHWREGRSDDYQAPRLGKIKAEYQETPRTRVLSDDELRLLWPAFEQTGRNGQLCKLLLFTACRLKEIAELSWSEVDLQGATITIPAARYKTRRDHIVPLSEPALAILEGIERKGQRVFGAGWGFSDARNSIERIQPIAERWTFHDLRRTARTLMAGAGVDPHICERVLGHVLGKIEGTYDRYAYAAEKRRAVDTLARAVDRIVNPETAKVVKLRS